MPVPIPVFCHACGSEGNINKVTASLKCACGSDEIGLVGVDTPPLFPVTAEAHGRGTGWGPHKYDPTTGLSDYAGPSPAPNPVTNPPVSDNMACPACHGSGQDPLDFVTSCRECGGSGVYTPPTSRPNRQGTDATVPIGPQGGAGWRGGTLTYPNTVTGAQNTSSTTGTWGSNASLTMTTNMNTGTVGATTTITPKTAEGGHVLTASCPLCKTASTWIASDVNEDAWWLCRCGSLADLDKHPHLDPYHPPSGFIPVRTMKTGGRLRRNKKTGKIMKIMASVLTANTGIEVGQALTLARQTLTTYPER